MWGNLSGVGFISTPYLNSFLEYLLSVTDVNKVLEQMSTTVGNSLTQQMSVSETKHG